MSAALQPLVMRRRRNSVAKGEAGLLLESKPRHINDACIIITARAVLAVSPGWWEHATYGFGSVTRPLQAD